MASRFRHHLVLAQLTILIAILAPVALVLFAGYRQMKYDLTESALIRRDVIAAFAAHALEERFQGLKDLGVSLVTRPTVRDYASEGRFEAAVNTLADIHTIYPHIDRIFIANIAGIGMAMTPSAPELVGKDFSSRDWYQELIKEQKPYISEIYTRLAEPRGSVVTVAVPIRDRKGVFVAILGMQIRLDWFLQWSRETPIGRHGRVYFIDKNGNIAGHSGYPTQDKIINYGEFPFVQKMLAGEQGIVTLANSREHEEQIIAYAPVKGYRWGAVIAQRAATAFDIREQQIRFTFVIGGIVIILSALTALTLMVSRRREDQVEHMKDEFIAIASHELRTPVTAISEYCKELLRDEEAKSCAKVNEYVPVITQAADRLSAMTNELLDAAQLEQGTIILHMQPIDLSKKIMETVTFFMPRAQKKGISLIYHPPKKKLMVQGDPHRVGQIIGNLIDNAIKWTEKGSIVIHHTVKDDMVITSVRDTGRGITKDEQKKLFEKFTHTARDAKGGAGMGLFITKKLLAQMKGEITVESKPGKGSTFSFSLKKAT